MFLEEKEQFLPPGRDPAIRHEGMEEMVGSCDQLLQLVPSAA
jgi:hypothetical protein